MASNQSADRSGDLYMQEARARNEEQGLSKPMLVLVYGAIFVVTALVFF